MPNTEIHTAHTQDQRQPRNGNGLRSPLRLRARLLLYMPTWMGVTKNRFTDDGNKRLQVGMFVARRAFAFALCDPHAAFAQIITRSQGSR